jgi:uncharacterized membrane protein
MLNRRHRVILFITLVITGTSLLAGASLTEGLGICILGVALAWAIGSNAISDAAANFADFVGKLPNKSLPWLRVPLVMALSGCLLVAVALWSNFNSFMVVAALCIVGVVVSPLRQLPTERRWLKLIVWLVGSVIFFFTAVGVMRLSIIAERNAGRIGELAVSALIALPIGMFWLAKGWRLLLRGISAAQAEDPAGLEVSSGDKGTIWLHLSLFVGAIAFTLILGLLAFLAFSDSTFPLEAKRTSASSNPVASALFLMLLASWPYSCWKSILQREPNTSPLNVKRHTLVTAVLGGVFIIVQCVAIVFGIQNGNDRVITAQVEKDAKSFQEIAVKIGAIKGRDLRTTQDYIAAYEEIDPLLGEFDVNLQQFRDFLSVTEQRDQARGPLNIQRMYLKHDKWTQWDTSTFALLNQDSEITKKQIQVVRQMALLPKESQVDYWKSNFRPLQLEEEVLRQKLATATQTMPSAAR